MGSVEGRGGAVLNWSDRNEAWEARTRALGARAVLHVGHTTLEAQARILELQRAVILPALEEASRDVRPLTYLLDFGCGVGRWTDTLQRMSGALVIGVDPTRSLLEMARAATQNRLTEFKPYVDGRIPMGDGIADVVFCCMVLSTVLDEEMLAHTVAELGRVLRPDGLMFLVDNTAGPAHRPVVRSPYSMSRTVEEYKRAFSTWTDLVQGASYVDLGETNTIMHGRKR